MKTRRNSKHKNGFTIGELLTVLSVIGIICVVAIPIYLRIRMNTNMEMVRQHVRVIGEKMSEIYNKNQRYPEQDRWPLTFTGDPDEKIITANLDAIEKLCYTTNDYIADQTGSQYIFSCKPNTSKSCGAFAGNKRFAIHADPRFVLFAPGVAGEVNMLSGLVLRDIDGIGDYYYDQMETTDWYLQMTTAKALPLNKAAKLFENMLISSAERQGYYYQNAIPYDDLGSLATSPYFTQDLYFSKSETNQKTFDAIVKATVANLEKKGYQVTVDPINGSQAANDYINYEQKTLGNWVGMGSMDPRHDKDGSGGLSQEEFTNALSAGSAFRISVRLDGSAAKTIDELHKRVDALETKSLASIQNYYTCVRSGKCSISDMIRDI